MNPQNIKTAASESSETGFYGQEIKDLNPELAKSLAFLISLREERMPIEEREELLQGTLSNMATQVCRTVTDWSIPKPMLPLASFQAWVQACHIAHALFGASGEIAWGNAS